MSLPVKCFCVSLLFLALIIPTRCLVDKFDLFSARRNCYCEVAEGFREPCYEGDGGNLDETSCNRAGCCFLQPLLEEAPRCFLRRKSCYNKCVVEKYMRKPCMGWLVSKSACEFNGCCFDRRTFPSCYHGAEELFVDFVAKSPAMKIKQPESMDRQIQALYDRSYGRSSEEYKEVGIVAGTFNFAETFPRHVNCYCNLPTIQRKPCVYGGAELDRQSCNKHGCCYQEAKDTDAPTCYERKDTCSNMCGVNEFQRKPCLTLYASKNACHAAGCCYKRKNVPSCYKTADATYEKFLNRNVFYEWSPWSEWSACSSSCSPGETQRSRVCRSNHGVLMDDTICDNNPIIFESKACNENFCRQWSDWVEDTRCTANCYEKQGTETYTRTCPATMDATNRPESYECYLELRPCENKFSCEGMSAWGNWEAWSPCSDACRPGIKERYRSCYRDGMLVDVLECENSDMFADVQSCNDHLCVEWSDWEPESECRAECRSIGDQNFIRKCLNKPGGFHINFHEESCYSETRTCNGPDTCPPTWGEWAEWSVCSESCSWGVKVRTRSCYNEGGTLVGNNQCENSESYIDQQSCNHQLCLRWSEWKPEAECTALCKSSADQKFIRECLDRPQGFDLDKHEDKCYSDMRICIGPSKCLPNWGAWQEWSMCSEPCGPGIQERTRLCYTEQGNLVDENECKRNIAESFVEKQSCNVHLCHIWSDWTEESECTAMCKSRADQTFGRKCLDDIRSFDINIYEASCYSDTRICDGPLICAPTWGEWQEWSVCSESCSPGVQNRIRSCYHENGTVVDNNECENPESFIEEQSCNNHLCLEWSEWEAESECSALCRSSANQTFARTCINETNIDMYDVMCYSDARTCDGPLICAPTWGEWQEWSVCSESCSPGMQDRIRSCYHENGTLVENNECENPESFTENQSCNDHLCAEWSEWMEESECTALCRSSADHMYFRTCINETDFDIFIYEDSCYSDNRTCDGPPICPPTWGEWQGWSVCSESCSPGMQDRIRSCYSENGTLIENNECESPESYIEQQMCNDHLCAEWAEWEAESECTALCRSSADQLYVRACLNETDFDIFMYEDSCYSDNRTCDGPLICAPTWGEWQGWSVCSESCSPGVQDRIRSCYSENGTLVENIECENPESFTENQSCNDHLCDEWSDWIEEAECTALCRSSADQMYIRMCLNETNFDVNLYENSCYSDNRTCDGPPICPPTWGEWEEWSRCSESCSPGVQQRYRSCYNENGTLVYNYECENSASFTEEQSCNDHLCIEWGEWKADAECTAFCKSSADQKFIRDCLNQPQGFDLDKHEDKCYSDMRICRGPSKCPPNWGAWQRWSMCSEPCSPGMQERTRLCYTEQGNLVDKYECKRHSPETFQEKQRCNEHLCHKWSDWTEESECTAMCKSRADQKFGRKCLDDTRNFDINIYEASCYADTRKCKGPPICAPTWGEWEEWSVCSDLCSPGQQQRLRSCYNENGTLVDNNECENPENFIKERSCNDDLCLEWSEWEAESECTALCRSSADDQLYIRTCLNETNFDISMYEDFCYSNNRTCHGPPICAPSWGGWQEWSVCSEPCSPGIQQRIRSCYNENGTLVENTECDIPDSFTEEQGCNDDLCLEWSEWTEDSECTALCRSTSDQTFVRICLNGTQSFDIDLHEDSCYYDNRTCDGPPICPPTWGEWEEWSICSESCSPGLQQRFRSCYNENGTLVDNNECENPESFTEEQGCNDDLCIEWGEWEAESDCTALCRSSTNQTFVRKCVNETNLIMYEDYCYSETRICDGPPICPPTWGEWQEWSVCSESCSPGMQDRIRSCYSENGTLVENNECENPESFTENQSCNDHLCAEWSEWIEEAECTALCRSSADHMYFRTCLNETDFDISMYEGSCYSDNRTCDGPPICPPTWGEWEEWSICSESCSPGLQQRFRSCYNENGTLVDNNECENPESFTEEQGCNDDLCIEWGEWEAEPDCTALCRSTSNQTYLRICLNETDFDINVYEDECYSEQRICHGPPICPPTWGEWQEWSVCSEFCSPGIQNRIRSCYNENGTLVDDSECENPDSFIDQQSCNDHLCIEWSEWEPEAECTALCRSSANQTYIRKCLNSSEELDLDQYETFCHSESRICDGEPTCPPTWGEWGNWSTCSSSCSPGTANRIRSCYTENGTLTENDSCNEPHLFIEHKSCNNDLCQQWSNFTVEHECNAACDDVGYIEYIRVCLTDNITIFNHECTSNSSVCSGPLCPGTYGPWSDWSPCGDDCGPSTQNRTRSCFVKDVLVDDYRCLEGEPDETQECNTNLCPEWNEWGDGKCVADCDEAGYLLKTRTCNMESYDHTLTPKKCHNQTHDCVRTCVISWAEWEEWSDCSNKCAVGEATRERKCLVDGEYAPMRYCDSIPQGEPADYEDIVRDGHIETRICNLGICPEWSQWSITPCTAQVCGEVGVIRRQRVCQSAEGISPKTAMVFAMECYQDVIRCVGYCPPIFEQWSGWGPCSEKCGVGTTSRSRRCVQQGKSVDPQICIDALNNQNQIANQNRTCNQGLCTDWAPWKPIGKCSSDCNGKIKLQRRCLGAGYTRPFTSSPRDNSCTSKTETCGNADCKVSYTDWGTWGPCSRRCGRGTRRRFRYCVSEKEGKQLSEPFRKCAASGLPVERETCQGTRC